VTRVRSAIDKYLSQSNQRRALAMLQNVTTALGELDVEECFILIIIIIIIISHHHAGIFGIFHFLGGDGVGQLVADKTWWTHGTALR